MKLLKTFDEYINEGVTFTIHKNQPNELVKIDSKELEYKLNRLITEGQKGDGEDNYKSPEAYPLLIWSAPGIGKTAIIEKVAKSHGMTKSNKRFLNIDLSTMRPEDFFLPAARGGKATLTPVEWLPVYDISRGKEGDDEANGVDGKGGIIFFNEFSTCNREVQDICAKLCDDSHRVGNFKLGSKWVIVAGCTVEDESPYSLSKIYQRIFREYELVVKKSSFTT